jgi:hypothetical protein
MENDHDTIRQLLQDKAARIRAVRMSHALFCAVYLNHYITVESPPFHKDIHRIAQDASIPISVILAFRGSGKSTLISLAYVLWAIMGVQQMKFVLLVGMTQEQARQMLRNIRSEIESNPVLAADLGPFREEEDELRNSSIVLSNFGAKIMAVSVGQSVRGLRHGPYRPQLIICDDEYYKKLYEGGGDEVSIVTQIEDRYEETKKLYDNLFAQDVNGLTKSTDLLAKIEEIKKYHEELLTNDDSIKKDIEDSKEHITDFYNFLFGDENNEDKTKKFIEAISNFHTKLTAPETGVEVEIGEAHKRIIEKHVELFQAPKGKKSRIEELEENIGTIDSFHKDLEKKVKPELDDKKKYLEELTIDIKKKQEEVNSLLSDATSKTLAEGYLQSMQEYSHKKDLAFRKLQLNRNLLSNILFNVYVPLFNHLFRHAKTLTNYLIFILPLVVICLIFIESDLFSNFLQINRRNTTFTGFEFTLYKTMVSLPLLWVSWFGQRNISQRKRLFEEYNHKLRVVQMYLMFITSGSSYPLDKKSDLEDALLQVIKSNPAEHLGKGETMLDNLLEKFRLEGFYKKLKSEIVDDVKSIIPSK